MVCEEDWRANDLCRVAAGRPHFLLIDWVIKLKRTLVLCLRHEGHRRAWDGLTKAPGIGERLIAVIEERTDAPGGRSVSSVHDCVDMVA